jgi:hypothetical protein
MDKYLCVGAQDLRSYMEANMDGCVSLPVTVQALLSTVRAAVPQHMATLQKADTQAMVCFHY